MTTRTQIYRPLALGTSLPDETLLVMSAQISEQLGQMFHIDITAVSEDTAINFTDIVGQNVTLRLRNKDGSERFWNGLVSEFNQAGSSDELQQYRMTVVPWLWLLSRTADFRVYQDMTVPDIIKSIFRDGGFSDFEEHLHGTYPKWEYCVQYRETDLNFISRLMEQEGIYYYFKHEDGKHTLMLCDSPANHEPTPGYETILYRPSTGGGEDDHEYVLDWTLEQRVQPGSYETMDYDFKRPQKLLKSHIESPKPHAGGDFDMFDYPGEWDEDGDGDRYTRMRLEELQAQHEIAHGVSNAHGIAVGHVFELDEFPREDQNKKYLVTSSNHTITQSEFGSSDAASESDFVCTFTAIDAQTQYRPARVTPKPVIQGPQTALVVGPAGEEIYVDDFGRIKVQFYWDRYGKKNEKSSCWMRVVQSWAGNKFGGGIIPRVGMEVLVNFLEGDPDCPIVVGCLYNGDNKMPDELPTKKTRSVFKTNSSKGGGGFNLMRFDDIKGKEQVFIHSQKRFDLRVKDNDFETIGASRNITVGGALNVEVGGEHNLIIKGKNYQALKGDSFDEVGGTQLRGRKGETTMVQRSYQLSAEEIVFESLTKISFKVGGNFVVIDLTGVSIQGMMTRINSGGAASPVPDQTMMEPLEPGVADTGEPGWLDRPHGGGGKGHGSHKLAGHHGPTVAMSADGKFYQFNPGVRVDASDPTFAAAALADLARIGTTPSGKTQLDSLAKSGNQTTIRPRTAADIASGGVDNAETVPDPNNAASWDNATPTGKSWTDTAGGTHPGNGKGNDASVSYDPSNWPNPRHPGSPSDSILQHEMGHADNITHGNLDMTPRSDNFDVEDDHKVIGDPHGPDNDYRTDRGYPTRKDHHDLP